MVIPAGWITMTASRTLFFPSKKGRPFMKIHPIQSFAAALATVAMLFAPAAMAAPATHAIAPCDVALSDGGTLVGQLVDAQGAPLANAPVALLVGGKEVVRGTTNERGEFTVTGLKGGVYEVAAPGYQGIYRLWAPRTAPPAANQGMLMVAQGDFVRGQYGCPTGACPTGCGSGGPFASAMGWISQHPIMTAGIVAAAVAIPLAIDDDDPAS
jgi:hypothetical protein